jgi:hypothetical protein
LILLNFVKFNTQFDFTGKILLSSPAAFSICAVIKVLSLDTIFTGKEKTGARTKVPRRSLWHPAHAPVSCLLMTI